MDWHDLHAGATFLPGSSGLLVHVKSLSPVNTTEHCSSKSDNILLEIKTEYGKVNPSSYVNITYFLPPAMLLLIPSVA